jgi:hypothetical protein
MEAVFIILIFNRHKLSLYLKQSKMPWFSFYLFTLFIYKIREQEGGTSLAQGEGLAPVGWGVVLWKGVGG